MRLACALVFAASLALAVEPAPRRLERDQLLQFLDARGEIAPVKTVADWQRRRASILTAMQEIMGPLPAPVKRCPLDVKIEEEVDCDSYVRRLVTYQSEAGGRVPAYLLIPKDVVAGTREASAILCLHPTSADLGHKVVVGLGGKANRNYAHELAMRGYVTLAPSYPLLANYQPDLTALGYASGTMKAIWDNLRGLDLLETLPNVKRGSFGAIGHSLGGHNAVYTAVFDDRIKVVVSSCGLDSYRDYMGGDPAVWAREKGWCQTRYMPRLTNFAGRLQDIPFDFPELIGALAPRIVFISAPLRDANFKWESVDRVTAAARDIFRIHGVPQNLILERPDSEHDFPNEMRESAYVLFDRHLR